VSDSRSIPLRQARRLVTAGGRYVDDLPAADALHVTFVRSPFPHAEIRSISTGAAMELPHVRAVVTLADLERAHVRRLPVGWVTPGQHGAENDLLGRDRVRYVGEPVAVVVGDDRYAAEDGAALVEVDYELLPAVASVDAALAPRAPILHPDWGENVLVRTSVSAGDPDRRLRGAAHVVRDRFYIGRATGMPLETRGALALIDPVTDELVLHTSTQSAHHARAALAEVLGRPESSIRIVAPDVGGSFGVKDHLSAEEAVVAAVALQLRAPVKWIEDRHEHLAGCVHSREQVVEAELAADREGHLLALRGRVLFDAGAYSGNHGVGTALYAASIMPGPYLLEDYRVEVIGVVTNKMPSAAYRGYGGPEAAFVMEGLLERLARAASIDAADLRRRNLVPPHRFPYRNAAGLVYDQGDYPAVLEHVLDAIGYEEERSRPRGESSRRRGVALACIVQRGGFGPSRAAVEAGMRYGGFETAHVRMDGSGRVVLYTGMSSQGQGVDTALAQICAARLGLDPQQDVSVVSGDTSWTPFSPVGAIASRGAAVGGAAVYAAAEQLATKLRRAAGVLLEVGAEDVELRDRSASVVGAPDRTLTLEELAGAVQRGEALSPDGEAGLEAIATFEPGNETTSYAAHAAIVEVAPETGHVRVIRYVTASDCGILVNPGIVRGQIAGAVVQGIGEALMEELIYDEAGNFLTPTLAEYHLPTAADVPAVEVELVETPTPETPTGARGAGEIGITGPAAVIAAAVWNALDGETQPPRRIPLTPARVWRLAHVHSAEGEGP
jgi:aerobic carbon-monoxide dehydrogenase large subunit